MAPGTSPSIAVLSTGSYVAAFQVNLGTLGININGSTQWTNTNVAMMPGTSPGVAALPNGIYVVAFQSNLGTLGIYSGTQGQWTNTNLGMKSGSPASPRSPPAVTWWLSSPTSARWESTATGQHNGPTPRWR